MKGEGVREGAKRPTAPPSLDFNYYLIIDDCFWRQVDLPPLILLRGRPSPAHFKMKERKPLNPPQLFVGLRVKRKKG